MTFHCFEFTEHARNRFAERFPGENIDDAVERSVQVSFRKLMAELGQSGRKIKLHPGNTFYRDPVTSCLFIVRLDQTAFVVITCWRFTKPAKRKPVRVMEETGL